METKRRKRVFLSLLLLIAIGVSVYGQKVLAPASSSNVSHSVRVNDADPNNVIFLYSSVNSGIVFTSTSIDIKLSGSSQMFNVIIDCVVTKVVTATSATTYNLATGLAEVIDTVELWRL